MAHRAHVIHVYCVKSTGFNVTPVDLVLFQFKWMCDAIHPVFPLHLKPFGFSLVIRYLLGASITSDGWRIQGNNESRLPMAVVRCWNVHHDRVTMKSCHPHVFVGMLKYPCKRTRVHRHHAQREDADQGIS